MLAELSNLTVKDLAKTLTAAGDKRVTVAMIRADIEAGAPVNEDGTVSMLDYAAWLVKNEATE